MPEPPTVRARDVAIPGTLALLLGLVVVGLTLVHDHGDVSRFVTAGSTFVAPRQGLHVSPGLGYDGQFVYRLALAPFDLRTTAHGITLDSALRAQRIGLPALAWLASLGGRPSLVPGVLVAIDLVAVAATGAVGGAFARTAGRHPAWGVLLAAVPGLAFGIQHDLTEPLEIALLVGALLLHRRGRRTVAGLVLVAAALTRETALLTVAALAAPRLWAFVRRADRRRPDRGDLVWLLPTGAFAVWELATTWLQGGVPLHGDTSANLGAPLLGPAHLAVDLFRADHRETLLAATQLLLLAALLAVALPDVRRATAPLPLAWSLSVAFSACLSPLVWEGYDDLRFLLDLSALTTVIALTGRRNLAPVGLLAAAVWVFTLVIRVT